MKKTIEQTENNRSQDDYDSEESMVLITGNVVDGLDFYGPFSKQDFKEGRMAAYANDVLDMERYVVGTLHDAMGSQPLTVTEKVLTPGTYSVFMAYKTGRWNNRSFRLNSPMTEQRLLHILSQLDDVYLVANTLPDPDSPAEKVTNIEDIAQDPAKESLSDGQ